MTTSEQHAVPVAQEVVNLCRVLAKADGLDWDEVCPYENDCAENLGDVACDSGTCVAAHYEDHDVDVARGRYIALSKAVLATHPCKSGEGAKLAHEYGPSRVGHGESQCVHCLATNRENAVIAPNVCSARVATLTPDATQTREAEGENTLPACTTCGAPAGLDCRTGQGRIPPCLGREPETQVKWRERWYGSEPQKGSAIVDERGNLIAYFGGDKATHKATTAAVAAHNAALGVA